MTRSIRLWIVLLAILGSVPLATAQAQNKEKEKEKKEKKTASKEEGVRIELTISIEERKIIVDWFSNEANTKGLPPGLAKRDELPPGLQKQLARNGTLPPGLEKKLEPLPPDLSRRLSPLPDGVRRVILAGSVLLLEDRTGRILDLIEEVVELTR